MSVPKSVQNLYMDTDPPQECNSDRTKGSVGLLPTSLTFEPREPTNLVIFWQTTPAWCTQRSVGDVVADTGTGRISIKDRSLTTGSESESYSDTAENLVQGTYNTTPRSDQGTYSQQLRWRQGVRFSSA